ncbi:MAG: ABC transporter ATP-binding protein [Spirochaetes bacterium]|nr:ABC transporter ATP-binding protein [Spirochaetota bacterium]
MLLKIENMCAKYGNFEACRDLSIEIEEGGIVAILGANGAGKTTLLKAISGLISPVSGDIYFKGKNLKNVSTDEIVKMGISLCPESRMLFPEMPVHKNLELGAYVRRKDKEFIERTLEEVYELFPKLKERRKQAAGTLSGGEQQMVAIGRALMSGPQLLMLDELSIGLAPILVMQIMDTLLKIKERGTAILLVEQNAAASFRIADRGYLMETGRVVRGGTREFLMNDEEVKRSYLGVCE